MSAESDARAALAADVDRAIGRLVRFCRDRAADVADVRDERIAGTVIRILSLEPQNPAAVAVSAIGEQWLVVGLGRAGNRWELDYDDAGLDFAEQVIDAAIAGRVVQTVGEEWSRIVVTFADDSVHEDMAVTHRTGGPRRLLLRRRRFANGSELQYQAY